MSEISDILDDEQTADKMLLFQTMAVKLIEIFKSITNKEYAQPRSD